MLRSGLEVGPLISNPHRSPDVDMSIALDEIKRAHRLAPEIVPESPDPETLSYIVGIRPSRDGGFRLEKQKLGQRYVLSAYGFGGNGYQYSYGVGDALTKMVEDIEIEHITKP